VYGRYGRENFRTYYAITHAKGYIRKENKQRHWKNFRLFVLHE